MSLTGISCNFIAGTEQKGGMLEKLFKKEGWNNGLENEDLKSIKTSKCGTKKGETDQFSLKFVLSNSLIHVYKFLIQN